MSTAAAPFADDPYDRSARFVAPSALAGGLRLLYDAAPIGLRPTIQQVLHAAWNPHTGYSAEDIEGYQSVVDHAVRVCGWTWTDDHIINPEARASKHQSVCKNALRSARRKFPDLNDHDRGAAVDDLLFLELVGEWLWSTTEEVELPGWMIPGIVYYRLPRRLASAKARGAKASDAETLRDTIGDAAFARDLASNCYADDAGIEASVWASAAKNLVKEAGSMLADAKAGAPRAKLTLAVAAALVVLRAGTTDALGKAGESECRTQFSQDWALTCFQGLRTAAPDTWGQFTHTRVPVLSDLREAAAKASEQRWPNAAWFGTVSTRKNELHKRDFLLHTVHDLVERFLREAAHDADF